MPHAQQLLLLGTGQVAKAVIAEVAGTRRITATTRNPDRLFELAALAVDPLVMPQPFEEIIEPFATGSDVLISFPPDGQTDAILAPACSGARRLIYISTTGVYGKRAGTIDDTTAVDQEDERAQVRLKSEEIWRAHGAVVLRAPGIYGPASGLHLRLLRGNYKLPDTGSNMISRIHVCDLARIIAATFERNQMSANTYVLGDLQPCSQLEIVSWLCQALNLPLPESAPLNEVSPTLRGNRQVDSSRILTELDLTLRYPTYKDGYLQCLEAQPS
jgi:nucleoside-diphosphate-sugar epimerase